MAPTLSNSQLTIILSYGEMRTVPTPPCPAMYVCLCNGITDREIRQTAVAGCRSMAELTMRTGCGAGCGSCVPMATALMQEVHDAPAVGSERDVAFAA
jgi:bacterioferritin-associated ferredoxin